MSYEKRWKILEDLYKKLKDSGMEFTEKVIRDLRSAKTLIQIGKREPGRPNNVRKIEVLLDNLESHLILSLKEIEGIESAERWMRKLEEARPSTLIRVPERTAATGFPYGVPRDKHWIRVKLGEEITEARVRRLADDFNLEVKKSEEDHIIIYGETEDVKNFVKRIAKDYPSVKK